MHKNYICTILVFLITFAVNAFAEPITFTHEGFGSGTLDGNPFTDATFVITAQADTDNRASRPSVFWIDHTSASITISGLGTIQFITNTRTFVSDPVVGFSRAGELGLDLFNGPQSGEFNNWDMLSAIGPISGDGELLQWEDSPVNTSAGVLVFTSAWSPAIFQAGIGVFCGGRRATIVGTETNDKLIGTDGPDVIHGLGGFDIIWGMGGDDVICGGDGTDNLSGRHGNDIVLGGDSHDSIWGGPGNDIVEGGDGNDSIFGGPGNDTVRGDNGNDSLYGLSGTDRLYGGSGPDNNDTCYDTAGTLNQGCEVFYEE